MKKGQIFNLTVGSYSDYCLIGSMKVLKDFDLDEVKKKWFENKYDFQYENLPRIGDGTNKEVDRKYRSSKKYPYVKMKYESNEFYSLYCHLEVGREFPAELIRLGLAEDVSSEVFELYLGD